jgi:hypothetical protein
VTARGRDIRKLKYSHVSHAITVLEKKPMKYTSSIINPNTTHNVI